MTKGELLRRLNDIEWDDFEVKEASGGLPKSMWETVSAFFNTSGGWIILGVRERKTENGSEFIVNGVPNPEQMEQENIWESFQLIMHRLRNFVDAPYMEGPDIFGMEDNSQLFCLREGLVNCILCKCLHKMACVKFDVMSSLRLRA